MEISITLEENTNSTNLQSFYKNYSVFYTSPLENAKYSSEKENLIEST